MTDVSDEPTPTALPELDDEILIVLNGGAREIVMKFALLRELTRAFPNPNDPALVFQDQDRFDLALSILLIPRNEVGRVVMSEAEQDEWSIDDFDLHQDEAIKLVKWAMEHVLRFFLTKFSQMTTLGEQSLPQIETLLSSLPGLSSYLSKKPSAGPMDFSTLVSEVSTGKSPTGISEPT